MPSTLENRVAALTSPGNQPAKDQIEWLYGALTILDAKANGMLQINGLVMTVIAAFVAFGTSQPGASPFTVVMLVGVGGCVLAFATLVASSLFCMNIVRMGWGVLTDLTPGQPVSNFDREIEELCMVTDRRTQCFWWAWRLSRAGFVLTSVLALLGGILVLARYW